MNYDATLIYDSVKELLRQRLTDISFDTWFKNLVPLSVDNNVLILETQTPVAKDIISARFASDFAQCLKELGYDMLTFNVIDAGTYVKPEENASAVENNMEELVKKAGLNPRYTFDNFVSGANNRLAYASAVAVADFPGNTYNPLYIWGSPGLGKTHLMQSIGHHVLQGDPTKKVLYVSSETFTSEMITAISTKRTESFRQKYREIDVLLIDDIQFLGGKEGTQDEFFHTFNALYQANKQIVISGDRPPEEIQLLEERIRSRFKWGMLADIKAPDYETRVAILQKKAHVANINIDLSVLSYIANNVSSNIRELEGALTRVDGFSRLYPDRPIDIEVAQEALKDYIGSDVKRIITIPRIIDIVCERYDISADDIRSKKKPKEIAYPRQIAMYLSRKLTDEPLVNIGSYFGGRDHTTVMHASNKIEEDLKGSQGDELRKSLEDMKRRITGE